MRYTLCRFRGDGLTRQTMFTPDIPDGEPFDMIDLRPDYTKPDGFALVCLLARDTSLPIAHAALDFGNDKTVTVGPIIRNLLANRLGINLDADVGAEAPGVRTWTALGALAHGLALRFNNLLPTHENIYEVFLGNEKVFDRAVPQGGAISTDNFNRANALSLGSPWAVDIGSPQILSNVVRVQSGTEGGEHGFIYDVDCGSGDMYVQATLNFTGSSGNIGLTYRNDVSHIDRFETHVNQANLNVQVVKYVSAGFTEVRAGTAAEFGTWASGDTVMKCTVSGSSHTIYRDGSSKVTFTDAANSTRQRGGMWFGYLDAYTGWSIDNYEQGKMVEGGPFPKYWGGVPFALGRTKGQW